ncbi:hypothetical protein MNBD_CHLOROFLEXI01-1519 [hydrothermal vent metagenome]|uniref:DUF4331 domain-containing protein n=1 Tax=hydrothermal vent metagenome TaxID=652676 RepID=A0A3B0WFX0_9ZZZZ
MKKIRNIAVLLLVAAAMIMGLSATTIGAADHLDAPLIQQDGRTDINDIYAFTNGDNTVLAMTVNPLAGVLNGTALRPAAQYDFVIDNDGDYQEDIVYRVQAGKPNGSGQQQINLYDVGALNPRVANGTSESTISVDGGGSLYVGLRDDPFFFDLVAFQDQVLGAGGRRTFCDGNENDFFAGANVTAIVLEIPSSNLTAASDSINIWTRTADRNGTIDRMGKPVLNTVLISSGNKDAYNATTPAEDVAVWSGEFEASLLALSGLDGTGYTQAEAEFVTSLLLPDVLTLDTTSDAGFTTAPLNGRQPAEDVIDFALFVVTGGLGANGSPVLTGDCVDANDVPFLATFPYLAPAN